MEKKKIISVVAVLLLLSLATKSAFATTFAPILDEFWIVKDSTEIFRDSFDDTVPPPSGPDPDPTYGTFGAGGFTGGETNGKLTMTPSQGDPIPLAFTGSNADLATIATRRLSPIPTDPNFLGFDNSFEIHGLYDMSSIPMVNGQTFQIRVNDNVAQIGGNGNNSFAFGLGFSPTNEVSVFLSKIDFQAFSITNIWWSSIASLLPSADQIELILFKERTSNMLNASYFVYDINDNVLGTYSSTAGAIYQGEDFIRPQFGSSDIKPIPEPATMLLLGTGLAGIAGAARRRKKNQA